jgi:hypothetical protein
MRVKFKTWDELEKEFGLDIHGDIKVGNSFTEAMEAAMPSDRVIHLSSRTIINNKIYMWNYTEDRFFKIYFKNLSRCVEKNNYLEYVKKHNINIEDI